MPKISSERKEARRRQILEAAQQLFSSNGFHQTGMTEIVAASGLSRGAVYGYFDSKDEIIEALADDRHSRESALSEVASLRAEPLVALRALVRTFAQDIGDPNGVSRRRVGVHGWAEALRNERVRHRIIEGTDAPRALIRGLVERAQRDGSIRSDLDPDAVARSLIALFQGFVLQETRGESFDIASCLTVVDQMLDGLLLKGPGASRGGGTKS
jgi:AcrR family transcriptional regulator